MNTEIYKNKLEEEKKILEEELSSLGKVDKTGDWEATPEEQTYPESDENDMADRTEDYGERSSTLNALELRLKDVNEALSKIENGNYGVCEICQKTIEGERLEVNPSSRTCIDCKEKII
jgi:RNA polymerase-binding transcription factor DksA